MSKICIVAALCVPMMAMASWYWPFDDDDDGSKTRVSELLEPASLLIDKGADYAEDGKVDEAVEEYRKALAELDRIELENPDRIDKPEFATVRNKRAYVNSSIDSLLLNQARMNAKAVAITDTTELEKEYEKRLAERRAARNIRKDAVKELKQEERRAKVQSAAEALAKGDDAAAMKIVDEILEAKANDAAALNIKAKIEIKKGDLSAAEKTLGQCIRSNPRSYHAYYNMARVLPQSRGDSGKIAARKYYKMGRSVGGPKLEELEQL